jgi:hypothetical protein
MTDSFHSDGRWRLPWPKPPPAAEWCPPAWFTERMYDHPFYKFASREELEYYAKHGRMKRRFSLDAQIRMALRANERAQARAEKKAARLPRVRTRGTGGRFVASSP